ncbi:MAG: RagB/SusD family nutrient uptake outer membrane protein [Bacteroidetes bacterium]|jgi:hypothetical protein|nr:RagB/SusD family nutrient uptake outer membrane protein [Bacteroidota bacterium]
MKKAILLIILPVIAISLFTCKKAEKLPKSNVDSLISATPHNKTGVNNLLLQAYDFLDGVYANEPYAVWHGGTDNWFLGSVTGGDAYRGGNTTDQGTDQTIDNYSEDASNNWLLDRWQITMQSIRYSNAVLAEIPLVKDGSLSASDIAQTTAEARFLRGFYELELAKLWHNVPYIDEKVPYNNGYNTVSNPGPIWSNIEDDFTAAMNALPTAQVQLGRPNKYAAEAFLAKTYMFDHKYSQAQPLLNDLINSGVNSQGVKYDLVKHYADNFNPSTKNGPEGVFVIQARVNDGTNGQNGNAADVLNFPDGGPATCCLFFKPSFSFVNAFKTDQTTGLPLLDTYNDSDIANDVGLASTDAFTPTTLPLDSRLDWSVGRRGIPYLDWGNFPGQNWSGGPNGTGDVLNDGPYVNIKTVYYQAAQATTSESYGGWANNQATSNSYNAIRFADVLLWAAEVEVEMGSLQKAEDYVNRIRSRAADATGWVHTYQDPANPMGGYTNTPAANYKVGLYGAAGGNASTGFVAQGQNYARKAVYFERMLELGMEGHRFFDLQRWDGLYGGPAGNGYMANVLNAYVKHEQAVLGTGSEISYAKFTQGRNEIYPIPNSAITASKGLLKQNPGY